MTHYTEIDHVRARDLFAGETRYQTPKVDVRAAVFSEDRILLVKEGHDLKWCMPGGWIDIESSIKESAIKEVKEESGIDCAPRRIIFVVDRRLNATGPTLHTIFTFFVQCDYLGGHFEKNLETIDFGFFGLNDIPEPSENKTTLKQIRQCFQAKGKPLYETTFQ